MDEPKSKSQKKRDAEALQQVGMKLVHLPLSQLDTLPLPAPLKQAIIDARSLKSHGAIRRQAQWIGKLMRGPGSDVILSAYEQLLAKAQAKTGVFHEIETWRARLIEEGNEALTVFIAAYPSTDIQYLRQLVKKAREEQEKRTCSGASKVLFRYLRTCIE